MDDTQIVNVFEVLKDNRGAIGLIAMLIFFSIRIYRLPDWQDAIPASARWDNLHVLVRYGIIASLAGIGAGLADAAKGLPWQHALEAAIAAAMTAIVANKATKTEPARAVADVVVPPAAEVEEPKKSKRGA